MKTPYADAPGNARLVSSWEECRALRGHGLGSGLTEDQAVAASVELIDNGLVHVECEDGSWYRPVAVEAGGAA